MVAGEMSTHTDGRKERRDFQIIPRHAERSSRCVISSIVRMSLGAVFIGLYYKLFRYCASLSSFIAIQS
jgi:hypothetical protein